MLRGALEMFRSWRGFKAGGLSRRAPRDAVAGSRGCLHRWAPKAAQADEEGKRRGVAKDLRELWPTVFQFIDRGDIEPTNNRAERDLRPVVPWRTGSFGTRSRAGSDFVARILSVWATCRTQRRDGPMPNNLSASMLRQPVVGRKNWLSARPEGGAHAAATVSTLVGGCMLHDIDPGTHLGDAFDRLLDHPARDIAAPTPQSGRRARGRHTQDAL